MEEIKEFDKVLLTDQEVVSYEARRLTDPGENYGSLILAVKVLLKNGETQNVVAKLCPPNEWIKKMFNIPVAFKKELNFYQIVVPTLQHFIKDQRIDFDLFPRFRGGRVALNAASGDVDDDALLLMENMQYNGFELLDRMVGFDLPAAKVILKDLAVFHALPIALKLMQPDLFNEKILPNIPMCDAFSAATEEAKVGIIKKLTGVAGQFDECKPHLSTIQKSLEAWGDRPAPSEPFATIVHNDFWINNVLLKFVDNQPMKSNFLDFQLIDYGSPVTDLIFFLFTSLQSSVLAAHYDQLVQFYHAKLIDTLTQMHCDTRPFVFERFQAEIKRIAPEQLFHVLVMMKPIYSLKGSVPDLKDFQEEDMMRLERLSDLYPQRIKESILGFVQRGLI